MGTTYRIALAARTTRDGTTPIFTHEQHELPLPLVRMIEQLEAVATGLPRDDEVDRRGSLAAQLGRELGELIDRHRLAVEADMSAEDIEADPDRWEQVSAQVLAGAQAGRRRSHPRSPGAGPERLN